MRVTIFSWMQQVKLLDFKVGEKYGMQAQTIQLAFIYADIFLSNLKVIKDMLQLIGLSSLLVAYKVSSSGLIFYSWKNPTWSVTTLRSSHNRQPSRNV